MLLLWLLSLLLMAPKIVTLPTENRGLNLLSAVTRLGNPLFSFTTQTTTYTETLITTEWLPPLICARLVNVTGPCRFLNRDDHITEVEEPVVLTFDDDMDEADILMKIKPTVTLKVEPTPLPGDLEAKSTLRLEASRIDTAAEGDDATEDRSGIGQAIRNFFNVVNIEYKTVTLMSTTYEHYTTRTVFIMNCTPDPFTQFPQCISGPRRSAK